MKYDFIEIGTSDFNTLIEKSDDNSIGLSIEALPFYLNKLPNKKNVKKLNKIVVSEIHYEKEISIFYVEPELIEKYNLPTWVRGCSCIHKPHETIVNMGYGPLITSKKIEAATINEIFQENDVSELDVFKIDTEGYDCHILQSMMTNAKLKPKKIIFESNQLTNNKLYNETIQMLVSDYILLQRTAEDTTMILRK